MNTPICDFVEEYAKKSALRAHMPGHKGKGNIEKCDITEIEGADSLYEASGIIKKSEDNAGRIFGANTFYSTEGSSLSIRAMLYLACKFSLSNGQKPLIAAGRNAHKVFLYSSAVLDFDIDWLYGEENKSYLSCKITAEHLEKYFLQKKPTAVYITNPDYLGNMVDIKSIAKVCRKNNVLLLVDNAHGAYFKFLGIHPIDLGADMCADSAHKTLDVITGGAYLHISHNTNDFFKKNAKNALAMFGSTSPSYLILQSLDKANKILSENYKNKLSDFICEIDKLKKRLIEKGYVFCSDEPLKLTFDIKKYGYTGLEFAKILSEKNVYIEFFDNDFAVMMLTLQNGSDDLKKIENVLLSVEKREEIVQKPPIPTKGEKVMRVREAMLSSSESISVEKALGRILSSPSVSCPPAVPIAVCGERISQSAIDSFKYYGIKNCEVTL